jgi:hypothetical protein
LTSPPDQTQIKPLGGRQKRISTTFETQPITQAGQADRTDTIDRLEMAQSRASVSRLDARLCDAFVNRAMFPERKRRDRISEAVRLARGLICGWRAVLRFFPARDYRHACGRNESSGNYANPVFSFGSVKYDRRGTRALNKAFVANGVLNTSDQAINGTVRRYPCHDIAILVLNIKLQNPVLALGKRTELEQEKTVFRIDRWFSILIFVKGEGERDIIQRNSGPIGDYERQTTVRPYSASAVQFHRQLSILGSLLLGNRCMQGQDAQDC